MEGSHWKDGERGDLNLHGKKRNLLRFPTIFQAITADPRTQIALTNMKKTQTFWWDCLKTGGGPKVVYVLFMSAHCFCGKKRKT